MKRIKNNLENDDIFEKSSKKVYPNVLNKLFPQFRLNSIESFEKESKQVKTSLNKFGQVWTSLKNGST